MITTRLCMRVGALLFVLSFLAAPATPAATTRATGTQGGLDCLGNWACAGTVYNGCTFTAGKVPSCVDVTYAKICAYATPGYLCQGTDANGVGCTIAYRGCQ